jgi:hypothetical protein
MIILGWVPFDGNRTILEPGVYDLSKLYFDPGQMEQ